MRLVQPARALAVTAPACGSTGPTASPAASRPTGVTRLLTLALSAGLLTACMQRSPADLVADAQKSMDKGEFSTASIALKNALVATPGDHAARIMLARALLRMGDLNGAQIELQKALGAGADADEVVPTLVTVMLYRRDWDRLIAEHADTELKRPAAQAQVKGILATAYGLKGKLRQAEEAAREALRVEPGNVAAELVLVRLSAIEQGAEASLKKVNEVVSRNPDSVPALLMKAELAAGFERPVEEVRAAYAAVLEKESNNVSAMAATFSIDVRENRLNEARSMLRKMQSQHPKQPATLYCAVLLASQEGDQKKAHELSQQLLKAMPDEPRAQLLAGAVAYQRGAYLEASRLLGKASLDADAKDTVRLLLARSFLRVGEAQRALVALRPLLERKVVGGETYAVAAEAQLQLGELQAAQQLFEKAAQRAPEDSAVRTAQIVARAADLPPQAVDDALRRIGAGDASAVSDMALISHRIAQRQLPEALQAVDALEKKLPTSPLSPMLRGRIALLQGNTASAREQFEAAQAKDPLYVPAAAALAGLDVKEGKREAAAGRYEKVIDARDGALEAEMALIALQTESGMEAGKLQELIQRTIKRHPGEPHPRLALIRAKLNAGQVKEALTAAQEGATAFPQDPAFFDMLALALQRAGEPHQALAAATKMASLTPSSPVPFMRMAQLSLDTNDRSAAKDHLRRAVALRKDYLPAQSLLALLLATDNKAREAREITDTVMRQRPKDAAAFKLVGDVERQLKQYAAAATAYRTALKLADSEDLAIQLHGTLAAAGRSDEARELEAQWLAAHPRAGLIRYYLAERAMLERAWPRAEELLQAVIQLAPQDLVALNNLAWVQLQAGKAEAMATVDKALKMSPQAPALLDTKAMILAAAGRLDEALALQRQAVERAPDLSAHRLHLAQYLLKAGKRDEARAEVAKLEALGARFEQQAELKALRAQL